MRSAFPASTVLVTGLVTGLGLTACAPTVPNSAPTSGVGFESYSSYMQSARTAKQPPAAAGPASPQASAPSTNGFSTASIAAAINAASGGTPTQAAPGTTPATGSAAATPAATATAPSAAASTAPSVAPYVTSSTVPSNGSVGAPLSALKPEALAPVSSPVSPTPTPSGTASSNATTGSAASSTAPSTAASNQALIAANRAKYVVIQPAQVPQLSDHSGPDIAKYAQETTNPVGVPLYPRPSFYMVNVRTACQAFTSSADAQTAFLAAGGPQKDTLGLDPDGDGFACSWNPAPYRKAKP